tara:strand:+ start:337 stop:693 length:357 start_codon:yes stop_codon:yes gene_type:complete
MKERLANIETLRRQLATFSTIDPTMSIVSMQTLTEVLWRMAEDDTNIVKQADVVHELPVTHASVSRAVTYWSEHKLNGKDGKGFLLTSQDPENRRYTLLRLSGRGSMFSRSLFVPREE